MATDKILKLLTQEILVKEKGIIDNTFVRFIGPADSMFSLFNRSFGHRKEKFDSRRNSYIIYDKNENNINMFKHMLEWDGTRESFVSHIELGESLFNVKVDKTNIEELLRLYIKKGFTDWETYSSMFNESWNNFKNSKFTFYHIDIVEENQKFLRILESLPQLGKLKQFVKIDFNQQGIKHEDAIHNILHKLWLIKVKTYSSVVEINQSDNKSIEDYAGKLYAKLNPTFCILPWMHIQYKPSGQSKLCCRYDTIKEGKEWQHTFDNRLPPLDNLAELYQERTKNHNIQTNSMEDSFFSNYWNKARELTIKNKEISGCHKCYKEENVEGEVATSMRLGSAILYNQGYLHKKVNYETPSIEFLEVGFGNYCNLACLSCNSTLSTTWHDDEIKLNSTVEKKLQRVIFPKLENLKFIPSDDTLRTLKIIKFTGGEPMINPEFTKFIELICERGFPENVSLEIYTNCSYIPSPKLLSNLTKFKNIQLNLSIDAYGNVNDYIRYGSLWNSDKKQNVSSAIDFWLNVGKTNDNFSIIMSTTLSILNILEIPKLMSWWMDKFKESGNKIVVSKTLADVTEYDGFFKIQLAHDPSYINLNILPKEYYSEIDEWVENYKNNYNIRYPDIDGIPECIGASLLKVKQAISKAKGNKEEATSLLNYLYAMDKIRNNSCEETIPLITAKVKEYLQVQGKLQ